MSMAYDSLPKILLPANYPLPIEECECDTIETETPLKSNVIWWVISYSYYITKVTNGET